MIASADHLREARAACNNLEEGSRISTANERTGRTSTSAGIFRSFALSKDAYVREWLRSVYGEEM